VVGLLVGIVVLALGGPLHWLLEPSAKGDSAMQDQKGETGIESVE
jgi:hypothetical protein